MPTKTQPDVPNFGALPREEVVPTSLLRGTIDKDT